MSTYWRMMSDNALIPAKNLRSLLNRLKAGTIKDAVNELLPMNTTLTKDGLYLDSFSDDYWNNYHDFVTENLYDLLQDGSTLYWCRPDDGSYWKETIQDGKAIKHNACLLFNDGEAMDIW